MDVLNPMKAFKNNEAVKNFLDIQLEKFKSLEYDTDAHNLSMNGEMSYDIRRGDLMIIILMAIHHAYDSGYIDSSYAENTDLFEWFRDELREFVKDNYE